jgi:hypothetical protein
MNIFVILFILLVSIVAMDSFYLYFTTIMLGIVIYGLLYFTNSIILPKFNLAFGYMDIIWVSLIITAISYVVRKLM